MASFPSDIYTEPEADPDTLSNLGPLGPMAGVWTGEPGDDVHPSVDGSERDRYVERYELQPIDPQTNGPQLLYGLRYHLRVVKPGEVETFHDQVGYWLWEPAARTVTLALAIPRGQVLLAAGPAEPDATEFTVTADVGSEVHGICSNPFLRHAFRTVHFRMTVSVHPDGSWSYDEDTVMQVLGREELFHHTDRNTLILIEAPIPNPLALAAAAERAEPR